MFSTLVRVIGNAGLCNADRSTGASVHLACFLTTTAICHQSLTQKPSAFLRADGGPRSLLRLLILLLLLFLVLYHSNLF